MRRYRSRIVTRSEYKKLLRLREIKYMLQGGKCFWCWEDCFKDVPDAHPQKLTAEHIRAIRHGGLTTFWNVVAACFKCNNTKSDKENPQSPNFIGVI